MQERCDMKEIQKMLGSFSCPELGGFFTGILARMSGYVM